MEKVLTLKEAIDAIRVGKIFELGDLVEIPNYFTGMNDKFVEFAIEHKDEYKSLSIPYLDFGAPEYVIYQIRECFKESQSKRDNRLFYNEMKSKGCLHNCGLED